MQTLAFTLSGDEWTEILGGNNALGLHVASSTDVRLHFNDSATAPALSAASILVQSFPPRWDFDCQSQVGQARVWARSDADTSEIVVVRRTL